MSYFQEIFRGIGGKLKKTLFQAWYTYKEAQDAQIKDPKSANCKKKI